eukprot:97728-Pyramimonas_sp.AAC.1
MMMMMLMMMMMMLLLLMMLMTVMLMMVVVVMMMATPLGPSVALPTGHETFEGCAELSGSGACGRRPWDLRWSSLRGHDSRDWYS